ncbi:hypothetical protein COO60DRAFT_1698633 [Scenedesmus sp. NREL 46B-D3]|nr:hypothetical protein COO60DRAFT_1698633 [Scenedesmus sp. NREL 46B-D3]
MRLPSQHPGAGSAADVTLELDLLPTSRSLDSSLHLSKRTAAEQAIAAALQTASAAGTAAGSGASGLLIPSCKLTDVGLGSADILQALPGSTLTILELKIDLPADAPADAAQALTVKLGTALQRLQQLQTLGFAAPSLTRFAALTNLTRIELLDVQSGEQLLHLPMSLVELHVQLTPLNKGLLLLLGHLTGLAQLAVGEYNTLRKDHVLPPNLLPVTQLQELTLEAVEFNVMPAADMQQLTCLTALKDVELVYGARPAAIDKAAAGWPALPLTHLHLFPGGKGGSLRRSTLLQLTSLTALGSLDIGGCGLLDIEPDELAEVLTQLERMYKLSLYSISWQQQQQQQQQQGQIAAGVDASSSPLTKLLQGLAARMDGWHLIHLCLQQQHVGRAEAAALGGMEGLQELTLQHRQLEDCSLSDIALQLKPWLVELDVSESPG